MLSSNVPEDLMKEIIDLVPDTINLTDEYWRIVPNTLEGFTYSVSSKRDIIVRHSSLDAGGRILRPMRVAVKNDKGVLFTTIRRSSKEYSSYMEHVRYDTFPELNTVKTLEDDIHDAVDIPYEGIDWYGRHRTVVHMLPVSEEDMQQVREFYPIDLPRELWAYVPDTNRKYVISSQCRGVILKRYRVDGGILKAKKWQLRSGEGKKKYLQCCMTVGDTQTNSVSHQYVLKSFVMVPGADYEVNHIDGDTYNNILDNLEWVTRQENSDHYNKSPEMAEKRALGYRHISEWGRLHQKEIQNRPEVNAKRGVSVAKSWTVERKRSQSAISKSLWTQERKYQQAQYNRIKWDNATQEQQQAMISGLLEHNQKLHEQKLTRQLADED